ncbi:uncharacterized protein LOC105849434 isoform X2 [Hydra vulgaris]|uniref:uncharacterized protein LOC105849434 isoform X2 n=1 Tax=Hydra vulgaris TaxID=6087 RepID=UPI001F5E7D3A|nr:uncharacterized protein LOC105849434 isoform X3 [Hydra vulgaris]
MIIMVLTIFMLDQSCSFFIQRGKNSDIVSGNPEYCSGLTFCQCINSTFLDFDSKLNCGNQLPACRLLIEGRTVGIYTAFGMSSYNLILATDTNDPVCNTEPIPVPIFVQDYQNIMVWNPVYNTLLQRDFSASIKDISKVELKIKSHLQGLLLKVFINCDNKEQCITIKFEGIQEYPLNPDLFSNYLGAYSTSASPSVISRMSEITSLKVSPATSKNSIASSIQNINQSKSVSSINIASPVRVSTPSNFVSSPVIILTPSNFVQLYFTDSILTPLVQTAMLTYSQVTKESTIELKITNQYNATLVTVSTSIYVENTTILPPQSDALTTKTFAAQVIIGVSAVLLLLVFLFACFLAYKRKRRKSQFKIPKTFDTGLASLTDVSLNNHAAMIRMENNSLSTSASMMNNAHLKSNPIYLDYFEQESLNGLEDIPIDEQITSKSLDESFIFEKNYSYKKDTKVNNRRLSVIFSVSQSLESTVPKDDEQSSHNDFPFSFSIEHGSTPIVNKI